MMKRTPNVRINRLPKVAWVSRGLPATQCITFCANGKLRIYFILVGSDERGIAKKTGELGA